MDLPATTVLKVRPKEPSPRSPAYGFSFDLMEKEGMNRNFNIAINLHNLLKLV
jgi:hypothetical protein